MVVQEEKRVEKDNQGDTLFILILKLTDLRAVKIVTSGG